MVYPPDYVPPSAMAIFAHPDDSEFYFSGTIAFWAKNGCEVTFVVCTDGSAGGHQPEYSPETLVSIRKEEQLRACDILGVTSAEFLQFKDCELEANLELRRELVRAIRKYKPSVIVCCDPETVIFDDDFMPGGDNINHPDDRAAALGAIEAAFPCSSMPYLWRELGEPHQVSGLYIRTNRKANVWVDISETITSKINALKQHQSQLGEWDADRVIRGWAALEGKEVGISFAEKFRVFRVTEDY